MDIFINAAVNNGLKNYLKFLSGEAIDLVHVFEFQVIKTLVNIYGKVGITEPYKIGDPLEFKKTLTSYGLGENDYEAFIQFLNEYDLWLNSSNLVPKTDLPIEIAALMIKMVDLKNQQQKILPTELQDLDGFFDPTTGDMVKLQNLIITDKTVIPRLWREKKAEMDNPIPSETSAVELLAASDYKRFGLSIDEVKELSDLKIQEINDKILAEDAASAEGGQDKFDPKKLILTSGSGFVDTIVLLSIIATEIMIGLLIAFAFLK